MAQALPSPANHPAAVPLVIDDLSSLGDSQSPKDGRGAHLRRPDAKFNPQAYQKSLDPMLGSLDDPNSLFNPKLPNLAINHEKPEHRIVFYLKAQGKSYTEIAKVTDYTISHLSQLCRQPWAQKRIMEEIRSNGGDAVRAVLEGEVINSLQTLVEVRDSSDKDSNRVAAANSLLDRHLGKPIAKIETTHFSNAAETISDVDRQLKEVRDQINRKVQGLEDDDSLNATAKQPQGQTVQTGDILP